MKPQNPRPKQQQHVINLDHRYELGETDGFGGESKRSSSSRQLKYSSDGRNQMGGGED